ncbi:MAG: hypothetical protein L6R40_005525 [Gallowayella cf. fulva]|nr:MAG: hypothetical protein L6R40_005525 [Xanthomendoza cf. fulva]
MSWASPLKRASTMVGPSHTSYVTARDQKQQQEDVRTSPETQAGPQLDNGINSNKLLGTDLLCEQLVQSPQPPQYAIDVRNDQDAIAGIDFARKHNIRLVIRNTGHE